ncbi:MAG: transcription termination/antitermination protein NusG [Chlamydiae bacterium CG10_big_fil_rev_8_21_14_0_10_35_9]|nr:MAG: transcription termination/antitermination protein NusG [Chlamydiae bacterium CG10_big_fil_rev_8_21_14_0_10_35_9]
MHKWYVLQVLSGHEKKVKKAIEEFIEAKGMADLIEEVVVPSEKVSEVKKGEQKVTEKRLWPGYVLIKMTLTDESWAYVKNSNGVIDFLGGEKPTALSEKEVEQILHELEEKKKGVVQKHKIEVGDKVKITDGVFVNFVGTVTEVFHDKGRLSVLVSIFGRDTRVDDLEFWQVEEVTNESDL